ncbi:MAG: hypothetical protein ACI4TM_08915 [Candidatus Cryptobacteroides sp.]
MKAIRFILPALAVIFLSVPVLQAQEDQSARYSQRYDQLVARVGAAGVGVETLLDTWESVDPENSKMQLARLNYYLTKAAKSVIVPKSVKKYLGNEPVLTLKDSTGNDIRYFEDTEWDEELFSQALKQVDKMIKMWPEALDYRFMKTGALAAYEKESPDMTLSELLRLADLFCTSKGRSWTYEGAPAGDEFFIGAMQEYCYMFFTTASETSFEAFKTLSEKMSGYYPKETIFISNVGSYWSACRKDPKKAMKEYNKVLKINPQDDTAIKNCILLCRKAKDVKQEKKYLKMMAQYGETEVDRLQAQGRLDAIR